MQNYDAVVAGRVEIASEGVHGHGSVGGVVVVDSEENRHDFSAFERVDAGVK